MRKVLFLIPARGGSKGIPGKNIKALDGKPLIGYAIDAAKEVVPDEQICVSTDSKKIIEVVEDLGLKVPFLRPEKLATDEAGTEGVIKHALEFYESKGDFFEYVVLLQPTSPFRTSKHIKEAIKLVTGKEDMVVSVKETKANPYYVLFEEKDGFLSKSKNGDFVRRQDCPKVFELNGAIYIIKVDSLNKKTMKGFDRIVKYEMSEEDSLDIDTPLDWKIAEIMIKNF